MARSIAINPNIILILANYASIPYSQEQNKIIIRFGQVFEQSYTRFLDLQKAEAQAREAQIEAALERVRSRTMAMQKSDELPEAANNLFLQVQALGIPAWSAGYCIWEDDQKSASCNMSSEGEIQKSFSLPTIGEGYNFYKPFKNEEPFYVAELGGKKLVKHYDFMKKLPIVGEILEGFDKKNISLPTFQIWHIVYFTQGYLMFITYEKVPEAHEIFKRFAKVFEQTYTRFSDLKLAEQLAIQAKTDLIKLHTEKKRAEDALTHLQAAQEQLVQQEKLASLGQLTAGIAHEIKNPLNFVNNFSDLSIELIDEVYEELDKAENQESTEEIREILTLVKSNLEKIHQHGTRADGIVKSMLQHSRGGSGRMELTNLNILIKEFVNLAFHGMRANKNPINVTLKFDLDQQLQPINLISEDFSRVVLNICNNAFDAMREKTKIDEKYHPVLSIKTIKKENTIVLSFADNGPGIPNEIKDKILQPFFTTKKGTDGTGLGLSITNDIIKSHGGALEIETQQKEGSTFSIQLPI